MTNKVIPDSLIKLGYPEQEDSQLWSELLTIAYKHDQQLARNLEGFRVEGMKLVQMDNGNYVMRPDYAMGNWKDKEDYKKYADKFLAPNRNLIVEILNEIGK